MGGGGKRSVCVEHIEADKYGEYTDIPERGIKEKEKWAPGTEIVLM